jgi:hypothetical protein
MVESNALRSALRISFFVDMVLVRVFAVPELEDTIRAAVLVWLAWDTVPHCTLAYLRELVRSPRNSSQHAYSVPVLFQFPFHWCSIRIVLVSGLSLCLGIFSHAVL